MKPTMMCTLAVAIVAVSGSAHAHHSFAPYDMTQNIEFKGVVDTIKFRNPHSALTLTRVKPDGSKETINFVESAPANMLVRMGMSPAQVAPGTKITAIGAPRKDDPNAWFLKAVVLEDGTRFQILPP